MPNIIVQIYFGKLSADCKSSFHSNFSVVLLLLMYSFVFAGMKRPNIGKASFLQVPRGNDGSMAEQWPLGVETIYSPPPVLQLNVFPHMIKIGLCQISFVLSNLAGFFLLRSETVAANEECWSQSYVF
jgi:hypothetical protein